MLDAEVDYGATKPPKQQPLADTGALCCLFICLLFFFFSFLAQTSSSPPCIFGAFFHWHPLHDGPLMLILRFVCLLGCRPPRPLASKCGTSCQRRQPADSPYLISGSLLRVWTERVGGVGRTLYLTPPTHPTNQCPSSSLTTCCLSG